MFPTGLVASGIKLIELYGGFTAGGAAQVIEAVDGRVPVGVGSFTLEATAPLPARQAESIQRLNPPTLKDTSEYGFAQAVIAPNSGRTVYLSGQFSGNTAGQVLGATMAEQIRIAFGNLKHAIDASGARPEHVVKILVLVADHQQEHVALIAAEINRLFGTHIPASTLIPVPRLALDGMRFEIDATLVIPN
jgi:enamine deaminase RidA (YjgF/YER057c/UK114 family)